MAATLEERITALEESNRRLRHQFRRARRVIYGLMERIIERGALDASVIAEVEGSWEGGDRPSDAEISSLGVKPRRKRQHAKEVRYDQSVASQ